MALVSRWHNVFNENICIYIHSHNISWYRYVACRWKHSSSNTRSRLSTKPCHWCWCLGVELTYGSTKYFLHKSYLRSRNRFMIKDVYISFGYVKWVSMQNHSSLPTILQITDQLSFLTYRQVSNISRDEGHLSFEIWGLLYYRFTVYVNLLKSR